MVNDYLGDAMGDDFTAKDFRTWGGTLHAVRGLAATPLPKKTRGGNPGERALAAAQNSVVKEVAAILGNTAAVCRKAYIDPVVFSAWRDGSLVAATAGARGQRQWERATLRVLRRAQRSGNAVAKRRARGR
jgi:DNA topoisomerase IB